MPAVDPQRLDAAAAAAAVALPVLSVVMYVWLGIALSRLFPRWGRAAWRGWVPFVNAGELLSIAGFRAWHAALLLVPVVQLYVLVMLAVAIHRITRRTGHGPALTVVGILVPPLWASLLLTDGRGPRTVRPVRGAAPEQEPAMPVGRPRDAVPRSRDASGFGAPVAITPPEAPPAASAQQVPPEAPESVLTLASRSDPTPQRAVTRASLRAAAQGPASPQLDDAPAAADQTMQLPAFLRHAAAGSGTASDAPAEPSPGRWTSAPMPAPRPPDDHGDTVVVDRRPRVRWILEVAGVGSFPLTGTQVIIGRRPSPEASAQALAIPDTTRTLSKRHARLDLADGEWTITDLNSTNGVLLVDATGSERLLDARERARVTERFVLGEVVMSLSFKEGSV